MQVKGKLLAVVPFLVLGVFLIGISLVSAETAQLNPAQEQIIILRIGDQRAVVGQEHKELDSPPVIINGRTMVPLRFIAEALGLQVRWDGATQTIVLGPEGSDLTAATTPAEVTPLADDQYVANAGEVVSAANWKEMTTVRVDMTEMAFTPRDLTFEAGKPYKLEIYNSGEVKHEFTADKFYRSIALRKVQDDIGEFKLPYLTEVEVFAGQRTDLYFVPLVPGKYELVCELPGHKEAGMVGTVTVTGTLPGAPEIKLAQVQAAGGVPDAAARIQAANWQQMETIAVDLGEMYFKPSQINLKAGRPYKLELKNAGEVKHEADAQEFFRTAAIRKAQDTMAEIKGPTFTEIEVFAGKQADLYLIPTQAGTFELACRIPGHYEAGMHGTIVVEAGP